ncbi:MAG: hypothetical protein K2H10_06350 [Bacteroidales bacterium]|nr:hypothetical protein [Bacteroidales bacterium]
MIPSRSGAVEPTFTSSSALYWNVYSQVLVWNISRHFAGSMPSERTAHMSSGLAPS